jgi:4'-phosphopantetheinyl transferase
MEVKVRFVNYKEKWADLELIKNNHELPRAFLQRYSKIKNKKIKLTSLAGMLLLMDILKEENLMDILQFYALKSKGKPYFENQKFWFNLSHSRDIVAIAWSKEGKVGVDVQEFRSIYPGVKPKIMHEAELSHPRNEEESYFFECWTKKEAVVKMTGEGLSAGIQNINSNIENGDIHNHPYVVKSFYIAETYFGAVAAEKNFDLIVN